MQHQIKAELEKSIHRSDQNLPLPPRTGQKQRILYKTIKSHLKPATTMHMQLQLS